MGPTNKIKMLLAPLVAVACALGMWMLFSSARGPLQARLPFSSPLATRAIPVSSNPTDLVEVQVKDVIPIEEAHTHAVVLVSRDEQTVLPIFVTEEAAVSIAFRLAQRPSPHPLSADLLDGVMGQLGGKVVEVRIDDVEQDIYSSHVLISQGGKKMSIEARPSDAIAMALSGKARIFCTKKVLGAAGITKQQIDELRQQMGVGGGGSEGLDPDAEPQDPDDLTPAIPQSHGKEPKGPPQSGQNKNEIRM